VAFPAEDLYNAHVGDGSTREGKDKHDPEPVTSFDKVHVPYETVKSFFYVHSAGGQNKHKILNSELVLFIRDVRFLTKLLSIRFLWGKGKVTFIKALMQLLLVYCFLNLNA
jgi:hypothetical protein